MDKKPPEELQPITKSPVLYKISARKTKTTKKRIAQGDIFEDIEVIESIEVIKSIVKVKKIEFPFVVCLNQECDLEKDFKNKGQTLCNNNLLHIGIAPAFIYEQFLNGSHWGEIFDSSSSQKDGDTIIKKIKDNEIPRYHYLKFSDANMPELVIDFKHFFTINRDFLYSQLGKRMCSMDDLFKEKINQRFSYYISRIGLPEN